MKQLNKFLLSTLVLLTTSLTAFAEENITFYHYDLLGSPVATTNEMGVVVWKESYGAWGEKLLNEDATEDNVRGYTGHVNDTETGLTYMQARYYDPQIGRFMGIDPVGFKEDNPIMFNRYAYANNNPYKYTDPNGEAAVEIDFINYQINTGLGFSLPLGHAGVLMIDDENGFTKYYEYGRYDPDGKGIIGQKLDKKKGNVRNVEVPNVELNYDGKPTQKSLNSVLNYLSRVVGKGAKIESVYHSDADFEKMETHVEKFANDKNRDQYSLPFCNCYDFKDDVISAGQEENEL